VKRCKNCGESIMLVNYSLGPRWMHNPPGYQEMNGGPYGVFWHCRRAVAEPVDSTTDDRPIPAQVVELLAEIEERQQRVQQLRAVEQERVDAACRQWLDAAARAAGLSPS